MVVRKAEAARTEAYDLEKLAKYKIENFCYLLEQRLKELILLSSKGSPDPEPSSLYEEVGSTLFIIGIDNINNINSLKGMFASSS